MKKLANVFLVITPWVVLLCLGVAYLWGRVFVFPWVWEEKERVAAPSGRCELVIYEGNRGAMSSFAYACFLVKPGAKANPNDCDFYEPVLSSSHVRPKVQWASDDRLLMSSEGGYVTHVRPWSRDFQVFIQIESSLSPKKE